MTVRDAREILGARVLAGEEHLDREVRSACGSDMMSDVLAFSKDHSDSADRIVQSSGDPYGGDAWILCVMIFVRGKKPDESMLEMARERGPCGSCHRTQDVFRLRNALSGRA